MKILLYILTAIALTVSCQKVIDVDLNETNAKVVIEANYTAEDSTVRLRLSQTTNYFEPSTPSIFNGASVSISDANGVSTSLISIGDGNYELTNYVPVYNSTYKMTCVHEGVTYTATCRLPIAVPLSPITYEFFPGFFGSDPGYACEVNYNDPAGVVNYYMIVLSRNGIEKNKATEFYLSNDLFSDGNPVTRPLFSDSLFNLGDSIGMELRSVDEKVYYYYDEVQSIAGGQSAAPGNPLDIWDNDALGYFSAYSTSKESVIIVE